MSERTDVIRAAARVALATGATSDEVAAALLAGAMWVGLSQLVPDGDVRARVIERATDRVCAAMNAALSAAIAVEVER